MIDCFLVTNGAELFADELRGLLSFLTVFFG